jgi:hypothetical protein
VLPSVHYGSLSIGKNPVKNGLQVTALVNGVSCGQPSTTSNGLYLTVVRGNDPLTPGCGNLGDTISILVNGVQIGTATWSSGSVTRTDITLEPSVLRGRVSEFVSNDGTKK